MDFLQKEKSVSRLDNLFRCINHDIAENQIYHEINNNHQLMVYNYPNEEQEKLKNKIYKKVSELYDYLLKLVNQRLNNLEGSHNNHIRLFLIIKYELYPFSFQNSDTSLYLFANKNIFFIQKYVELLAWNKIVLNLGEDKIHQIILSYCTEFTMKYNHFITSFILNNLERHTFTFKYKKRKNNYSCNCEICNRVYLYKVNMINHVCTNQLNNNYECKFCTQLNNILSITDDYGKRYLLNY